MIASIGIAQGDVDDDQLGADEHVVEPDAQSRWQRDPAREARGPRPAPADARSVPRAAQAERVQPVHRVAVGVHVEIAHHDDGEGLSPELAQQRAPLPRAQAERGARDRREHVQRVQRDRPAVERDDRAQTGRAVALRVLRVGHRRDGRGGLERHRAAHQHAVRSVADSAGLEGQCVGPDHGRHKLGRFQQHHHVGRWFEQRSDGALKRGVLGPEIGHDDGDGLAGGGLGAAGEQCQGCWREHRGAGERSHERDPAGPQQQADQRQRCDRDPALERDGAHDGAEHGRDRGQSRRFGEPYGPEMRERDGEGRDREHSGKASDHHGAWARSAGGPGGRVARPGFTPAAGLGGVEHLV